MADLQEAFRLMSLKPRAEGQTAFPDLGTILEAVRGVTRARGDRRAIEELNRVKAHKDAHPELYETPAEVKEMAEKIADKFGIKASKEKPREFVVANPDPVNCPHCGEMLPLGANYRMMEPAEMHRLADVMTELAVIAERNRSMPRLPLGDVVEEVA